MKACWQRRLLLCGLFALYKQYPALYCRCIVSELCDRGDRARSRTSRIILHRGQPGTHPEPLCRVEIARLGGGDHPHNKSPVYMPLKSVESLLHATLTSPLTSLPSCPSCKCISAQWWPTCPTTKHKQAHGEEAGALIDAQACVLFFSHRLRGRRI